MLKVPIAHDGSIRAASMGMAASRRDWKFEPKGNYSAGRHRFLIPPNRHPHP